VDRRRDLTLKVAGSVELGQTGPMALFPFIMEDPASGVVSTATLEYAQLVPLERGDLLTGPREVLRHAQLVPEQERRGAMLAGLLMLGDRRVVDLLRESWRRLSPEGRRPLTDATSSCAYAAVVDFYLEWLEGRPDEGDVGSIAGALARIALNSTPSLVLDVERDLPTTAVVGEGRPPVRILTRWTIPEYGRTMAPRLRALVAREQEPRVLPLVLEAWGIDSNADSSPDDSSSARAWVLEASGWLRSRHNTPTVWVVAAGTLLALILAGMASHGAMSFWPNAIFVLLLGVIVAVEVETGRILDVLTTAGIVLGFALAIAGFGPSIRDSALGVLVGGGSLFLITWIAAFGGVRQAIGGGAIKLSGMLGSFLGWQEMLVALVLAIIAGGIGAGVMKLKYPTRAVLEFGPYLALGGLIAKLYGPRLIQWYIGGA
jgi:prepilin signal peptidase PulO-like enzyme (type II secretory pathway)